MPLVLADSFADQIAAWRGFYALAGASAATLLGLLFVAMSLHTDLTGRDLELERDLWELGAGVLTIFVDVVLFALVFLIPNQMPVGVGLPLALLGLLALLINALVMRNVRRVMRITRWILAPALVSCLLQIMAGVGIIVGEPVWLDVLAAITALLLLSALLASWLLLSGPAIVTLRTRTERRTPEPPRRRGRAKGGSEPPASSPDS